MISLYDTTPTFSFIWYMLLRLGWPLALDMSLQNGLKEDDVSYQTSNHFQVKDCIFHSIKESPNKKHTNTYAYSIAIVQSNEKFFFK